MSLHVFWKRDIKGPILNYKETHPHLLQQNTIYPDTQHVEIEPRSYLLQSKNEYDFVVHKLKQFKRKPKKIKYGPNLLFWINTGSRSTTLGNILMLINYDNKLHLYDQKATYILPQNCGCDLLRENESYESFCTNLFTGECGPIGFVLLQFATIGTYQ